MTDSEDSVETGIVRNVFNIGLVRLVLYAVVLFGAYIGLQIGVSVLAHKLPPADHDHVVLAGFVALGLVMLGVYALLVRLLERRRANEIAFAPGLVIGGAVFGVLLFCAVYAVLWKMGIAQWRGSSRDAVLALPFATAFAAAFGEELTFRGGIFRVLEDSFGTGAAVVISAAVFGLLHAGNHGATGASTAAIALEAGVLLGLAYAATRNLWFPIGLHFGWNFTEGGIFSAAVSGRALHGLVNMPLSGPDLLTGGAFGPEASVVAVAICLAASLVLAVITVRSGRWKPRAFRLRLEG
jgi:membrane protease YdiL (CAAX protease family)